jgi:hypothetical protein
VLDLGDRVLRAPVRTKPIRARLEVRLEDGFQHCFQGGLHHPVGDGGDSELAQLAARLGNQHLPHLDRAERPGLQLLPDAAEEVLHPDRLNRSPNLRERSSPAQRCNLVCIRRTATAADTGSGQQATPVFTGVSSTIAVTSLTDTLPPFPMRPALPASEYYDGSAPPAPFGWHRTYPPARAWLARTPWNATPAVPTFAAFRSTR